MRVHSLQIYCNITNQVVHLKRTHIRGFEFPDTRTWLPEVLRTQQHQISWVEL